MRARMAATLLVCGVMASMLTGALGCARQSVQAPPVAAPVPVRSAVDPADARAPIPVPPAGLGPADLVAVYFDFDSYALNDGARAVLDRNARRLRDEAAARITIEGHCDERGTVEYNQALGERRAQAAREYVLASGVSGERVQTVSYGKERPFDEAHHEAAWARNRRAHFVVR